MLQTEIHQPQEAADGTPVIVLMHGRGADASDLAPLRGQLPEGTALVLPRAPHPGAPWGYGPGWAWYRYEGDDRPEEASFRESQAALAELMGALPDVVGYQPGPVVLGGFSQGGTMTLGYTLQNPGTVPAALVFSGFLPDHPDVSVDRATVAGTAVWWGHGTQDPAVRHILAVRGRSALRKAGAELEARDYPMGHGISPRELQDACAWLSARI